MPFAVISSRWEKASFVEVDAEIEGARGRGEFGREGGLIPFIERFVEAAEILLYDLVRGVQLCFHHAAICVVGRLCRFRGARRSLMLAHGLAVILEPKLRRRQKSVGVNSGRLIGQSFNLLLQAFETRRQGRWNLRPTRRKPRLQSHETFFERFVGSARMKRRISRRDSVTSG